MKANRAIRLVAHRLSATRRRPIGRPGNRGVRLSVPQCQPHVRPPAVVPAIESVLQRARPTIDAQLSRREVDVVRLVMDGMTNREIAATLFISERTAEGHLERIRGKLGVRSRTEVAMWAARRGLGAER